MIVGTAGHIDHGKTSLVKALTGIDTDRLKEEKERGITIELGFAYVPLPDGQVLGFVDVPGHERFVHTMLAGAAGIDFVVLIVAADDGVMPQTREHLQILELLGVGEGVVALTKIDLVDAARRRAVTEEIAALLSGTALAGADVLPVSAITGEGIEALRNRLAEEAQSRPERATAGTFRMGVDRCFTLQGAGTVVTGTVISGQVSAGGNVRVLPQRLDARVRAIHTQGRPAETGRPGQRCALNLAGPGISKEAIARGDWLFAPGNDLVSERFDAEIALAATQTVPLRQWHPVHLHVGTSAEIARLVLLSAEKLAPGESGFVQVVPQRPLPVRAGDRFVLRDIGAERTIGGGSVIDPRAPQRRRKTPERLALLAAARPRDPLLALQGLVALPGGFVDVDAFAVDRCLAPDQVAAFLAQGNLVVLSGPSARFAGSAGGLARVTADIETQLARYHAASPHLPGMPPDKLRLALTPRPAKPLLAALLAHLAEDEKIVAQGNFVRLPSHTSSLPAADARLWEQIRPRIEAERYRPPTAREIAEAIGQPVQRVRALCKVMARMGELMEVAADRFFLAPVVAEMAVIAQRLAAASMARTFTAAEFKDAAHCGRNVGIQVLELFDRRGLTLRQGDVRRIVKEPAQVFPALFPGGGKQR
jgi:selenocysteine-specific elongation factor